MHADSLDYSGRNCKITGTITLEGDRLVFSDPSTEELCCMVAEDQDGPVTHAEPERFLRCMPRSLSGSFVRALLVE